MSGYTEAEQGLIWLYHCTDLKRIEKTAVAVRSDPALLFRHPERYIPEVCGRENTFSADPAQRRRELDGVLEELEKRGQFAVTYASEDYPEALRHISPPPCLFYGMGKRELLSKRKFCVVGSRILPPWASKLGSIIAENLADRFAVVTGLAEGGDLSAVMGAIESGNLISVLPCGLSLCYPAAHTAWKEKIAKSGLLLSEYRFDEPVQKYSFSERNRFLAALSEGVLVLAAGKKSGALITARAAVEFGREIFAIPYNPGIECGEGCNALLKSGAAVVTGPEDVLNFYGFEMREALPQTVDDTEGKILEFLRQNDRSHTAMIAKAVGMPVYEVSAALSSLEIKGAVAKMGGNTYSAVAGVSVASRHENQSSVKSKP